MKTNKARLSLITHDDLQMVVRGALSELLRRRPTTADQFAMLHELRIELSHVMACTTTQGVDGIAFRARLAAICDSEIALLQQTITTERRCREIRQ